jgi:phosphatidylinositol glycan class N
MNNICVVDDIVRQTEQLISELYGDQQTSYVFMADHEMSKIGSHGDGGIRSPLAVIHTLRIYVGLSDPDNTRTPLVAWGSGICGPVRNPAFSHQIPDDYSAPRELSPIVGRDVEQADVAALMSALLGTHWSINSVGVLPDVDSP